MNRILNFPLNSNIFVDTMSTYDFFASLGSIYDSHKRWTFSFLFFCSKNLFLLSRGSNRLSKATEVLVLAFFLTSFILTFNQSFSIFSLISLSIDSSWIFSALASKPLQPRDVYSSFLPTALLVCERTLPHCPNPMLLDELAYSSFQSSIRDPCLLMEIDVPFWRPETCSC